MCLLYIYMIEKQIHYIITTRICLKIVNNFNKRTFIMYIQTTFSKCELFF